MCVDNVCPGRWSAGGNGGEQGLGRRDGTVAQAEYAHTALVGGELLRHEQAPLLHPTLPPVPVTCPAPPPSQFYRISYVD